MRKFISILLVALMVVSLAAVSVSAADTVEVATAEQFASMPADGNVKLTADITIDASYAEAFTGTFDGNGHTVTVSAPMFSTLTGATVSNLTINGKIAVSGHAGAVAASGSKVTLSNITNNADISSSKESGYVGGMIGSVTTGGGKADALETSTFTGCVNNGTITGGAGTPRIGGMVGNSAKHQFSSFTNCVNNGHITFVQAEGQTALAGATYAGGLIGGIFHGSFVNCLNTGDIDCPVKCDMGGIAGRLTPSTQQADHSVSFVNCTNKGTLTDVGRSVGGIFGYAGVSMKDGAHAVYSIKNCVNLGNITNKGTDGNGNAGGLAGYVYGQDLVEGNAVYQYCTVEDSINAGNVTLQNTGFASQFIGYTNTKNTTIKNSLGSGKVTAEVENHAAVVALSSASVLDYQISGNKLVSNDGTQVYGWCADDTSGAEKNYANARKTLAEAPEGAVTFVDTATMSNLVGAASAWGYQAPSNGGTNTPDAPATGDNAIVWVAFAVCAVFGTAFAAKKKFN
ncbi:MAG: hypothetical protein MJ137_07505 [Clostridia bacterium]|nr:hypothetical protein [Clostridia bacterium]